MINYKINYIDSKSKYLKLKYQSGGVKTPCNKNQQPLILSLTPCPLTQNNNEEIKTDVKLCNNCDEVKPSNEFIKVCSDPMCNVELCYECVIKFHPCIISEEDGSPFRGEITKAHLSCIYCRKPIDHTKHIPKCSILPYLYATRFIDLSGIEYTSIADAIFNGVKIWRCSNSSCLAFRDITQNYGIFDVERLDCLQEMVIANEKHICNMCIQTVEEVGSCAKLFVPEKDEYGFYVIDGVRFRKCPNPRCNEYIERSGGCAHITCPKCRQHFCYCCETAFDNGRDTYLHIRTLFRTSFPTIEQIERMCMRVKETGRAFALDADFIGITYDNEYDLDDNIHIENDINIPNVDNAMPPVVNNNIEIREQPDNNINNIFFNRNVYNDNVNHLNIIEDDY